MGAALAASFAISSTGCVTVRVRGSDGKVSSYRPFEPKSAAQTFFDAAQKGTAEVRRLLDSGFDVNAAKDGRGATALMWAAEQGKTDIARLLLEKGVDVNATQTNGWTALMFAARQGHTEIVRMLLEKGADVNAQKPDGWTALMLAAANNPGTDTVRVLLDKGANVNARNKDGKTALALTSDSDGRIAQLLMASGAKPAGKALEKLNTALLEAAQKGKTDEVRRLLDSGAKADGARDKDGQTALMYAAFTDNANVARMLLDKGADVEARDNGGETALIEAAWAGSTDVARLLLDKGTNVNAKSNKGETALHGAGYSNILSYDKYKHRRQAILDGKVAVTRLLVENGANMKAQDNSGRTPLHFAIDENMPDVVRALLDNGASPNAKIASGDYSGWTVRDYAEYNGKSDIAQLLASKGGKTTGVVARLRKKQEAEQRAQRKREEAEARRAAVERERSRRDACSRVYVGQTFKEYYATHRFGGQNVYIVYEVRGFSPVTGEVTGACIRIENGGWGVNYCSDVEHEGRRTVVTTCDAVVNN